MRRLLLFLLAMPLAAALPNVRQATQFTTSLTCAYPVNVVSGNTLMIGFTLTGTTVVTGISDTVGSSFSVAATITANAVTTRVWVASAAASGADTITITATGLDNFENVCAEFTGVTATVDATQTGSFSTQPSSVTTSNVTTTVGKDLVFAYIGGISSPNNTLFNPASNVVPLGAGCNFTGLGDSGVSFVTGEAGTYNTTWTSTTVLQGTYVLVALKPTAALAIADTAVPGAVVNKAYSYQFTAEGGVTAYTWSTTSGTLPSGLSLSSSGLLSGTPTSGVTSVNMTFKVVDGGANQATKTLALTLSNAASTAAFVQDKNNSGTSLVMGSSVTAGNILLVTCSLGGNSIYALNAPPTDTVGTAFTLLAAYGKIGNIYLAQWIGTAGGTGADTITFHFISGISAANSDAIEFSGAQLFTDNGNQTVGASGTTNVSSSLTTLVPNEILLGASISNDSGAGATNTAQSPFTAKAATSSLGTGFNVVTTVTGYTVTFVSNQSIPWVIELFGFRPAGDGSTPPAAGGTRHKSTVI